MFDTNFRETEDEETIKRKLENSKKEIEHSDKGGFFDAVIINDDLELAYAAFKNFMFSQCLPR